MQSPSDSPATPPVPPAAGPATRRLLYAARPVPTPATDDFVAELRAFWRRASESLLDDQPAGRIILSLIARLDAERSARAATRAERDRLLDFLATGDGSGGPLVEGFSYLPDDFYVYACWRSEDAGRDNPNAEDLREGMADFLAAAIKFAPPRP